MSGLAGALRLAWRGLRRRPGFTLAAAVALGVGLGAAVGAFAIVDALFLRPLPGIGEPERLVRVELVGASSHPNFRDLERDARSLDGLAAFADLLVAVEEGGERGRSLALAVSPSYFRTLGVSPALGRVPALERAAPEVLLGHAFWRDRFGADPGVVGRVVRVNGQPMRVAGVAPAGFVGTFLGFRFDLWFPLDAAPLLVPGFDLDDRALDRLELVGRLAPGVGRPQAAAELAALAEGLRRAHPVANRDLTATVEPVTGFDRELRRAALAVSLLLLALAGGVLAVATSNVAGMLLARTLARRRELAVHAALGAPRRRIAALVGCEAALVAALGGALGLGLAATLPLAVGLLEAALPGVRLALDVGFDPRVALAAGGLALVVAALVGVPAALDAARASLVGTLRQVAASRSRLRRLLVAAQVAASAALLLLAALFLRALGAAAAHDSGLAAGELLVAPFVDLAPLGLQGEEGAAWFAGAASELAALPDVAAAAAFDRLPLTFAGRGQRVAAGPGLEPRPEEGIEATVATVSEGFLAAIGLPLRQGRDFAASDDGGHPPVAVVDAALASRLWPGRAPLGERLRIGDRAYEVVGVAESTRPLPGVSARPVAYLALRQQPARRMHLLLRPAGPPAAAAAALRAALATRAAALPPPEVQPLDDFLGISLLPQRIAGAAGVALGAAALLLAGLGLYALLAFVVAQARRELGVRLALGAPPRALAGWVARQGALPALFGAAVGIAAAVAAARPLSGMLLGVPPADPVAVLGVAATLAVAGLLGAAAPLRRALRTDPM
ncbi:MAG TPA: ABC transporter permease, partial [Thermoanaerobaculia bacterium]|nr:ABC transporter permease [Thermoanaerobaculia bacterium]